VDAPKQLVGGFLRLKNNCIYKEENEMEMNEKHGKIGEDLRGFEHERR